METGKYQECAQAEHEKKNCVRVVETKIATRQRVDASVFSCTLSNRFIGTFQEGI